MTTHMLQTSIAIENLSPTEKPPINALIKEIVEAGVQ